MIESEKCAFCLKLPVLRTTMGQLPYFLSCSCKYKSEMEYEYKKLIFNWNKKQNTLRKILSI